MSETEPTKKKGSVKPRLNLTKKKTAKEQAEPIVSENVVPVLSEIAVPAVAVPAVPAVAVPAVPAESVVSESVEPKTVKPRTGKAPKPAVSESAVPVTAKAETMPKSETVKPRQTEGRVRQTEAKTHSDKNMQHLLKSYLDNITKDSPTEELELEVKFGTMGGRAITRINYDTIIKKLLAVGFTIDDNVTLLRIQNEYTDIASGTVRLSNIRTEISGIQNVRAYCQTNQLQALETASEMGGVTFVQKTRFGEFNTVDMGDFNFRVSLSKETTLNKTDNLVRPMLEKWNDQKKTFRYLNRIKMRHPKLPVVVDLSVVKDSKKQGRFYVPEYSIADAEVFNAPEKYEVEIECINRLVGLGTAFNTADILNTAVLKPAIKYILAGMQETNYPISYSEQRRVLQMYMVLIWGKDYQESMRINAANFVGPSSYTLEMKHIQPANTDSIAPNIRENYTVTDKADGDRKLLFISPEGKLYLITTNMEVQFTGTLSKNKETWNSLLDGEHVLCDKQKKYINLYAIFDCYYIAGEDIRAKGFVPLSAEEEAHKYRLPLLESLIGKINAVSVLGADSPIPLKITKKRFYLGTATQSIFQGCAFILAKEHDGLFEYETDGLIFTPANRGVGSDKIGEYLKPYKSTWDYSFKWKPPQFNTIDFLVSVKKNANGSDFIGSLFQNGTNVTSAVQIPEYKTVILRVGFDESKHGFINPYQDAIEDKIPSNDTVEYKDKYVPMQFYPTEPSDYKAGICNLPLRDAEKHMYTEAEEIIEDNMIVEFRYDLTKDEQWRWVPLRVRYDKTAQLRAGEKNYGNAFHVANSNWHSIHNPISQTMIMTGEGIPEDLGDDDVYYNKVAGTSKTRALRDFHNLYVKNLLISSVAKPGGTLIDLAVGKGGDFPKWIDAKLRFVFGVDISRDNIQNRLNGAYARYLNYRKRYKVMPAALFVNGNSSVNIRKTTGILVDKDKQITRAVFGQGPKDAKVLGQGVYKQYGVAAEGFDVCSIQFAVHYMFENQETLQNFLQNVSEVTKEGGYFIGTSYDGELIFNMLKNVKENESKAILSGDESTGDRKKIWEVIKRYDQTEFKDDESCVGYAIDVFQETINKTIREYLVNYSYLTRVLENYGFVPVSKEELEKLRSPFSSGNALFTDLFNKMNDTIKKNPRSRTSYGEAPQMSEGERTISFLNRYFIYKKVRKVSDAEKVALNLQGQKVPTEAELEKESVKQAVTQALAGTQALAEKPKGKSKASGTKESGAKSTSRKLKIMGNQAPVALSDIIEVNESATGALEPVALEPLTLEPVALEPVALEPVALEPVALEPETGKAPVTKLKRVLKLKK